MQEYIEELQDEGKTDEEIEDELVKVAEAYK